MKFILTHPSRFGGLVMLAIAATLPLTTQSTRASDTDDRIESSARKSHVFMTHLKDDSISTSSKNGVVTLTGSVANSSHKSLAEHTVESLPGVTSVNNQLKIVAETPEEHSDSWVGMKVKSTLLFHRNVRAGATDVYVKDGVVSLRGVAKNEAQRELTAEYARDVEGVKEVKNEMTLAKPAEKPETTAAQKIDDASITAQVRSSLMSHRSTSTIPVKVSTVDGEVTVAGPARNAAEKSLVTKLVNDIEGVTSVVNTMTVARSPDGAE